ncbi:lipocalin-like domain-containing protein [Ponticaulis profundi]|uniref:Lipocalin-like domain-containing protein n=1 Tax=Ponticaulis profundi TaxID=2665222 RepID=A0ABW1S6P2_9PROT
MAGLIGAWTLVSSVNYRNDEGKPTFGTPPGGQLQYTADGRMGAFLQDPDWAARGENDKVPDSFTEFFAYAGRWELNGDQVRHVIEFASVPTRVGTEFTRTLNVIDDDTMELTTAPETSKSGAVYVTKLVWKRASASNQ